MTDIVGRLRIDLDWPYGQSVMREAADEIERLRAELRWISEQRWNESADLDDICTRADRTLNR